MKTKTKQILLKRQTEWLMMLRSYRIRPKENAQLSCVFIVTDTEESLRKQFLGKYNLLTKFLSNILWSY